MEILSQVLFLLSVAIFTWGSGSRALFKLNNTIVGWAVVLTMLIVQGACLWRICTLPLQ